MKQSLYYLVLHEMGHTLGLNHNMKASQMLNPTQAHNKQLTHQIGLTASVMDYPAANIALDKSKQGDYFTTRPGPYDSWAIEFAYSQSLRDEAKEKERMEKVRQRISGNFEQFIPAGKMDENRFEQEILYYLDKLDITEEKTRLLQHCNFFQQVCADKKDSLDKGKKLNFIIQEIGREVNTLGSKANFADIQRIVVMMKDEADKVKEQLANIL
jgi:hypothetical protein